MVKKSVIRASHSSTSRKGKSDLPKARKIRAQTRTRDATRGYMEGIQLDPPRMMGKSSEHINRNPGRFSRSRRKGTTLNKHIKKGSR